MPPHTRCRIDEKGPDARKRGVARLRRTPVRRREWPDELTTQMGPYRRSPQTSNAFDVDDVGYLAYGGHDVVELGDVGDFDHEVVDAAAVVGDGDLGLRDVAVLAADRPRDLGEQTRAIAADVDGHADRSLRRLLDIPLDVDDSLPIE